ncbi:tubulin-folding cofactor B [Folsomia candida]|uniref:Tubulin-folding cofactor B n=1 Tax=Folsomia candida TaxID=158441 RepID=A0A226ES16_FOLCA|nr:tubulin-folding cofactor B [Folsomia candida]OXA60008.1 Tubulin-folding cofactor B [Folsomia candida]
MDPTSLNLHRRRELLKVLNKLKNNIRRTQTLLFKADEILNGLEVEVIDFQAESDSYVGENETLMRVEHEREEIVVGAAAGDSSSALKLGDRVVWLIRNDEPVVGTVLWMGMMSDGLVAGVEFDDAIGNTDGNLDGKEIFKCQPKHGRFVLVRELILWKDFTGDRY